MLLICFCLLLGLFSSPIVSFDCNSSFDLLIPNESDGLALSQEGLHCLQNLADENAKISVVGVVGPYRSGKSFMLNQLIDASGRKNEFGVGNTVNPHTVGCVAYPYRSSEDEVVLFVDSAGLFAPSSTEQFDARVVALLSLISGLLIYNQIGVVHAEELSRFRFIVKYSQPLRDESSKDFKPSLLWVNQDFFLDIVDSAGQRISATEYLLNSFQTHGFLDIPDMFQSINGFAVPSPTTDPDDLKRLQGNPQLRSDNYKMAMRDLRQTVMSLAVPKSLGSEPMSATELVDLLKVSVRRLNSDVGIRDLNAMSTLMKAIQNQKLEDMSSEYMSEMKKRIKFPANEVTLYETHHDVEKQVLDKFVKHLRKLKLDESQMLENESSLQAILSKKIEQLRNENFRKLQFKSESVIEGEQSEYTQDWEQISFPQPESEMHQIHVEFLNRGSKAIRDALGELFSEEALQNRIANFQGRANDAFKSQLRVNRETSKSVCQTTVAIIKNNMDRALTKVGNDQDLKSASRQAEVDFSSQCRGPAKNEYFSKLNFTEFHVKGRKRIEELRKFWMTVLGWGVYFCLFVLICGIMLKNYQIYGFYFVMACFTSWIALIMFNSTVRFLSLPDYLNAMTEPIISSFSLFFYGTANSAISLFNTTSIFAAAYPQVTVALVLILATSAAILGMLAK